MNKIKGNLLYFIVGVIAILLFYTISWAIVCGLLYLISMCFEITFNLKVATGIWLIFCLVRVLFSHSKKEK